MHNVLYLLISSYLCGVSRAEAGSGMGIGKLNNVYMI